MINFLQKAVEITRRAIESGYYEIENNMFHNTFSLKDSIDPNKLNIIAELKLKSPTKGIIKEEVDSNLAIKLIENGSIGLSLHANREIFNGSLKLIREIAIRTSRPILFKDFIIDKKQIEAAKNLGASCILLIAEIFEHGLSNYSLKELVTYAKKLNMEVILEAHDFDIVNKINNYDVDFLGINNKNLVTLELNTGHFSNVIRKINKKKPIVAESGYFSHSQLLKDFKEGADCFLIGTSIMEAKDPIKKLKELLGND